MTQAAPLQKFLLVGTSRAPLPAELLAPELAQIAQPALDGANATPERRLWLAAGAADLWTRAGHVPPVAPAAAHPVSAPEQLAACPVRAESILKLLLQGSHLAAVLQEWLALLARKPARLPERFLPNMLDLASRQPTLRPRILPVLGTRGRWLAALEPSWDWAAGTQDADQLQETWHNGALEQRVAALARWRQHDPAAARQALQTAWPAEPPESRVALLACLATGLDAQDEAFLEAALDDRRKNVRQLAQRLLARLPDSDYTARMLVRAVPLLQIEKRLLLGRRLDVALPAERDAAMIRDGIGDNKYPGLGEKAGWLADLLSAIDPSHWSTRFGLTPDECIALSAATDYQEALLLGWTAGLRLHLEQAATPGLLAWLEAWVRICLKADGTVRYQQAAGIIDACKTLPAPALHALLLKLVEASHLPWHAADTALVELLSRLAGETAASWPAQLSQAIARRLLGALPALTPQHWSFRSALPTLAAVLDPAAVLAAEREWPGLGADPHGWQNAADQFFHLVRFRHEMIHSFQEHA